MSKPSHSAFHCGYSDLPPRAAPPDPPGHPLPRPAALSAGLRPPSAAGANTRELAAENQRAIRQGRDLLAEKHQAEEDLRRPPVPAFTQAAEQVIEMRRPTWSNTKHASQWENTLRTYAHPVIGRKPVDE